MLKINSKQFNFQFFLGGRKYVKNLYAGALENGGATKFEEAIISNIETDEFIKINEGKNNVSLFIPSTNETDKRVDNKEVVKNVIKKMEFYGYDLKNVKFYDTVGSWYSEDMEKVVIEDITIITLNLQKMDKKDIVNFVQMAEYVKNEMTQEGVSMTINEALAII